MFNAREFLVDHFVSSKGLMSFLSAYQAEAPQEEAVRKWFQRGTVPSDWLPVLLAFLEIENGQPVRIAKYLAGAPK